MVMHLKFANGATLEVPRGHFRANEEQARDLIQRYIDDNAVTYDDMSGYEQLTKGDRRLEVSISGEVVVDIVHLCEWCGINSYTLEPIAVPITVEGHTVQIPTKKFSSSFGTAETARERIQTFVDDRRNKVQVDRVVRGNEQTLSFRKPNGDKINVTSEEISLVRMLRWCNIHTRTLEPMQQSNASSQRPTQPSMQQPKPSAPPLSDRSQRSKSSATQSEFERAKVQLTQNFKSHLDALKATLEAQGKDTSVYDELIAAQGTFIGKLRPNLPKAELDTYLSAFRLACAEHVEEVDKIMGHGFLYRAVEAVVKGALILVVGVGMGLASFFGKGFADESHCKWYDDAFFTRDKTEAQKALMQFTKAAKEVLKTFEEALLTQPAQAEDDSDRVARGPAT